MWRSGVALALAAALGLLAPDTIPGRGPEPPQRQSVTSSAPHVKHHPPQRIQIPALGVDASVRSVGMADQVTMEIPDDIREVGWFRYSALPSADLGTLVLVGHRDGTSDPHGVFRNLGELKPNVVIVVADTAQQRRRYRVVDVSLVDKASFATLAPSIFVDDGDHRLVLLTCGGAYDRSRGGYQANVVVTAVPG
jgi:LPXTG-site transpeptidase (sortase) family protein